MPKKRSSKPKAKPKAKARKPAKKAARKVARKAKRPAARKAGPAASPAPRAPTAAREAVPRSGMTRAGRGERRTAAPAPRREPVAEPPVEPARPRATLLNCPKCGSGMQPYLHEGVELDRCTGCRGLWFDLLEHEDLKKIEGSEAIDIGDASTGREMNEVDRIQCPVCRVDMLRMSDAEQRHIWVESCPKCHGVFFDAGEFTDWKERDALDWLRSLVAGERS